MRDACRSWLPLLQKDCHDLGIGVDVSLRFRTPLKVVDGKSTVTQAKQTVRHSTDLCLRAVQKRLSAAAKELKVA